MKNSREIEFDKFVQNRYEQHEVKPPDDLWNAINSFSSDLSYDNFDQQINKRFTGHETTPPYQLWSKINLKVAVAKTSILTSKISTLAWIGIASISIITIIGLATILNESNVEKDYFKDKTNADHSIIIPKEDNPLFIDAEDTIIDIHKQIKNDKNTTYTNETLGDEKITNHNYSVDDKIQNKHISENTSTKDKPLVNDLEYSDTVIKKEEESINNSQKNNRQPLSDSIQSKKVDVERLVASTKLKSELNYNNESKSKLSNNNRTNGKINGPKKLPKKNDDLIIADVSINNERKKNKKTTIEINEEPGVKALSKLSIQAVLSASYSNRKLSSSDYKDISEYYNKVQHGNWNISGGVSLGININEKWIVFFGTSFSQLNQSFHLSNIHPSKIPNLRMDGNNSMITVISSLGKGIAKNLKDFKFAPPGSDLSDINTYYEVNYKEVQLFKFLNFPLTARYLFGQKKLIGIIEGGVITTFVVKGYTSISISSIKDDKEIVSIKNYHKINKFGFGIIISAGLQYSISKKVSFILLPTYQYSLTSLSSNKDINLNLYNLNISSGLIYKF